MIKERYCSYEVAILLKEKGFDELCENIYFDKGLMDFVPDMFDDERWIKNSDFPDSYLVDATTPTHQMAIDWLREVHKLYINIWADPKDVENDDFDIIFIAQVYDGASNYGIHEFSTYEQAF